MEISVTHWLDRIMTTST